MQERKLLVRFDPGLVGAKQKPWTYLLQHLAAVLCFKSPYYSQI